MRRLSTAIVLCSALGAASAHAQLSDADLAAREAIRGSFLSCAAAGVLSEQATVGEALRRQLALPADASRERIYDAICDLTAPRSPRVRKAGEEFILEAGELELRMRYDGKARHITWIDSTGRIAEAPKPVAEKPKPVVEAEKPKPVVEVEKPQPAPPPPPPPVVAVEKPKPAPRVAAKPQGVIRLPPPVVRTGPCIVKPVMSDEELQNCGASPAR